MFKKLRIKFIAITMVMVAIVMALAFTAACISEYQRSLAVVNTALSDAVDNAISLGSIEHHRNDDGMSPPEPSGTAGFSDEAQRPSDLRGAEGADRAGMPANERKGERPLEGGGQGASAASSSDAIADGSDAGADNNGAAADSEQDAGDDAAQDYTAPETSSPPMIGFREGGGRRPSSSLVPVAVYSVAAEGDLHVIPQVTSASISEDVLQLAASLALDSDDGYKSFESVGLHAYVRTNGDTTYLAFADTSYTDSWKSLANIFVAAGAGTLALFFIICLFYSKWALRPVREAWDSQRQFVADASHDLKTPLTVILANSSILLKHPERSIASESQWIESTQKEAEEMQGLVNEMLELAQIEAGQQQDLKREPIDFSDLVDGETLMFDSVALERACGFECSVESGLHVLGDEKQVKKLVATLVENAFKYVEDGGLVDISLTREGKSAVLSIRNTGSVISPDDLPHIFDRFYRTDKARTSGAGGFGLGLAIAREIALRHGGDITCASSDARGTTFTVTLPVS